MIVECDQCSTRFQLDESRIPARGIRVRCSRCKHAFYLKSPDASEAEAVEDVAGEAARAGATPPPDSTHDLPPQSAVDSDAESGEEDDWEFNHDDAPEDAFDEPAADGDDDFELDGGGGPDSEGDDDEGSIDLADAGEGDPAPVGEDPDEQSGFGGVDEMDALSAEHERAVEAPLSDEAQAAVDQLLDTGGTAGSDADLDDPENWDFFSDAALPDAPTAAQVALPSPPVETAAERTEPGAGLDAYVAPARDGSRVGQWLAVAGRSAGWSVTLGLLAVGVVQGLFPGFRPLGGGAAAEIRVGSLRVANVEVSWIDTARAGELLAIDGVLHNPSPRDAAPVGAVEVDLLDARGRPVVLPAETPGQRPGRVLVGQAGHPLDPDALRQLPRARLWAAHERAVAHLGATTLGPRESLPFSVLFSEVPVEARRYRIREGDGAAASGASGPTAGAPPAAGAAGAAGAGQDAAPDGPGASALQALELVPTTGASPR